MNEQDKAAFEEWWTTANVRLTDIPKAQALYIFESMLTHRDNQAAQAEPVAWVVMNGVCTYQICSSEKQANELELKMQKNHDLSGSWARFHVRPLYPHPAPAVAVNEQLYQALRHLYHNAKKSGAEMGLALDVAADAIAASEKSLTVTNRIEAESAIESAEVIEAAEAAKRGRE